MAEGFWGQLWADLRNFVEFCSQSGETGDPRARQRGHGHRKCPRPSDMPLRGRPQVPRPLFKPATHPHPSPQVIHDGLCVSQSKQWDCASKSYGGNKAISLLA